MKNYSFFSKNIKKLESGFLGVAPEIDLGAQAEILESACCPAPAPQHWVTLKPGTQGCHSENPALGGCGDGTLMQVSDAQKNARQAS